MAFRLWKSPTTRPSRLPRRARLWFEVLEDRVVPAVHLYPALDLPVPVLDGHTVGARFVVGDGITVADLDIRLAVRGARAAEIEVTLVAPDGTRARVFAGTPANDAAFATLAGGSTFRPEDGFLAGKNARGVWSLEIRDPVPGRELYLDAVALEIRDDGPEAAVALAQVDAPAVAFPAGATAQAPPERGASPVDPELFPAASAALGSPAFGFFDDSGGVVEHAATQGKEEPPRPGGLPGLLLRDLPSVHDPEERRETVEAVPGDALPVGKTAALAGLPDDAVVGAVDPDLHRRLLDGGAGDPRKGEAAPGPLLAVRLPWESPAPAGILSVVPAGKEREAATPTAAHVAVLPPPTRTPGDEESGLGDTSTALTAFLTGVVFACGFYARRRATPARRFDLSWPGGWKSAAGGVD